MAPAITSPVATPAGLIFHCADSGHGHEESQVLYTTVSVEG